MKKHYFGKWLAGGAVIILLVGVIIALNHFFNRSEKDNITSSPIPVTLSYDGLFFEMPTTARTAGDFLKEQSLSVEADDYIFPPVETELAPGTAIIVRRRVPVVIKVDGGEIATKTFARTVEDVLAESGVVLNHPDKIKPELVAGLFRNQEIEITRINIEEVTEEEEIDFTTVEKDDNTLAWRKTKIGQEGEKGIRQVKYKITYTDGKQTSKVKISTETVKKPVSKIVLNGTKIIVGKVSKGRASWYEFTGELKCASLEHPIGTWLRVTNTATGKNVIVQVNDRGPFTPDKIIDLDKAAFKKIGNIGQGVVPVKVEEIKMD